MPFYFISLVQKKNERKRKRKMNELWLSHGARSLAYEMGLLNCCTNTAAGFQSKVLKKHTAGSVCADQNLSALLWAARDSHLPYWNLWATGKPVWLKFLIYAWAWTSKLNSYPQSSFWNRLSLCGPGWLCTQESPVQCPALGPCYKPQRQQHIAQFPRLSILEEKR